MTKIQTFLPPTNNNFLRLNWSQRVLRGCYLRTPWITKCDAEAATLTDPSVLSTESTLQPVTHVAVTPDVAPATGKCTAHGTDDADLGLFPGAGATVTS
eukprot:m.164079 g.164079  ORF g.164079 m.164079 type:complete len:99 (+) comp14650_c0_seq11:1070-1366(+)